MLLAITVYVSMRLIFFEIRFPIVEELFVLIRMILAAAIIGIFIFGFLLLIEWIDQRIKAMQMNQSRIKASKFAAIAILIGIVASSSCGQLPNVGREIRCRGIFLGQIRTR